MLQLLFISIKITVQDLRTELRLFLKQFDFDNCYPQGILFMMKTKKTHPELIVEKMKSSVKYQDLIEDTKRFIVNCQI